MSSVAELKAPTINVVQIDGLALLKIIKHCTESATELVMGQLIGLDVDSTLEVSQTFPFPASTEDDRESNIADFQVAMLRALADQGEEGNIVGFYHAAFLSETLFASAGDDGRSEKGKIPDLVQAQFQYQSDVPNSVMIMFDPFKSRPGHLAVQAFRLTHSFMSLYAKGQFSTKALLAHDIKSSTIFEEVPLRVHNSHLAHAFLYSLRSAKAIDCSAPRLDLSSAPLLERMVDLVSGVNGSIDEFASEQDRRRPMMAAANRQRIEVARRIEQNEEENARRALSGLPPIFLSADETKVQEPSRLDSVLITTKIDAYCKDIRTLATETYQKQAVVAALTTSGDSTVDADAADA